MFLNACQSIIFLFKSFLVGAAVAEVVVIFEFCIVFCLKTKIEIFCNFK